MDRGTGLATAHPQRAAIVVAVALTALIAALLGFMAVPTSSHGSFYDDYRDVVLSDNPSIYWRFDESSGNASDASGNGRTGYYFGSPYQQGGTGINAANDPASKSVHFNDGNARSVSTHNPFNPYYVQSFEAWVCRDDDGLNDDTVFSGTGGDDGKSPYLALSSNGTSVIFDPNSGGSNVTIWGGVPNVAECNPDNPLEWTHLVVVVNTSPLNPPGIYHDSAALYVNGQNVGWKLLTVTDSYESNGAPEDNFQVGARYHNGIDKPFDGRVDEVAVYPRLLSPGEIAEHYDAGRGPGNPNGVDMFGFAVGGDAQNYDLATLEHDLDEIEELGASWIRIEINWAVIQAGGPSSYNWSPFDRVIEEADDRGLKILAVINRTPNWARPAGTDSTYGPDPGQYAAFAAEAVERYSAMDVHRYEVWNEPNIPAFWTPAPDPVAYHELLEVAYPAIKDADPEATVLTGGTAPAATNGTSYSPVDFLKEIYASGGGDSFDHVSHHPYSWPAFPGDAQSWSAWHQMYGTSPSLRSIMIANGDEEKEIWGTEWGAPTNGPQGSHVSEGTQADMLTEAYSLWKTYTWAGPLFTYEARDFGTSTDTRENFFGVLRYDFSQKPSHSAYQDAVDAME